MRRHPGMTNARGRSRWRRTVVRTSALLVLELEALGALNEASPWHTLRQVKELEAYGALNEASPRRCERETQNLTRNSMSLRLLHEISKVRQSVAMPPTSFDAQGTGPTGVAASWSQCEPGEPPPVAGETGGEQGGCGGPPVGPPCKASKPYSSADLLMHSRCSCGPPTLSRAARHCAPL